MDVGESLAPDQVRMLPGWVKAGDQKIKASGGDRPGRVMARN